jgi:hypothetical protein
MGRHQIIDDLVTDKVVDQRVFDRHVRELNQLLGANAPKEDRRMGETNPVVQAMIDFIEAAGRTMVTYKGQSYAMDAADLPDKALRDVAAHVKTLVSRACPAPVPRGDK